MSTSEYWAKRLGELAQTQLRSDEELIKELEKLYTGAKGEIESKISRWYMKFADNNEISMSKAKKLLKSEELEEFKWTVEEYIKHGENNVDDSFTKQLINASSKVHISRYESLLTELKCVINSFSAQTENKLGEHLKTVYSENYLHTAFEIQKGTGIGVRLGGIDERSLDELIKKPWAADGSNFSERIWKDRASLSQELEKQLKRNIALGKDPDEAAKAIAKRFETSKNNAYRLVQTESAAISARAAQDCYNALGVEEFEVLETLDGHTCEICGEMDGKHFPQSQYEIGVTVPPFHPRCRGTTVPYFADLEGYGERFARDLEGNAFYVPADTTYEQWKQIQDEKYGENNSKTVDNTAKSDIMKIGSGKVTINNIELPIEQRNTGKGNPNAILQFDVELNERQKRLLDNLPDFNSRIVVEKKSVNMADLAALTAKTGCEYSMFTKGQERLIIRGSSTMVDIDVQKAQELAADGYRWSGHTHPGVDINASLPSFGDKEILKCFKQEISVIYDSKGKYRTFEKE